MTTNKKKPIPKVSITRTFHLREGGKNIPTAKLLEVRYLGIHSPTGKGDWTISLVRPGKGPHEGAIVLLQETEVASKDAARRIYGDIQKDLLARGYLVFATKDINTAPPIKHYPRLGRKW